MIDLTTLRIDNLVRCDALIPNTITDRTPWLPPGIFRVEYINRHFVGLDLGFGATQKVKPEDVQGIEITEEWCKWCGFEMMAKDCMLELDVKIPGGENDVYVMSGSYDGKILVTTYMNDYYCSRRFSYIHDIQNIILDLTEKQLKYEIPKELREG